MKQATPTVPPAPDKAPEPHRPPLPPAQDWADIFEFLAARGLPLWIS